MKRQMAIIVMFTVLAAILVSCGGPSVKDIAGRYELIDMYGSVPDEMLSDEFETVDEFLTFLKAFDVKIILQMREDKTGSIRLDTEYEFFKWKPCVITFEDGTKTEFTFEGGLITMEVEEGFTVVFAPY